MLCYLHHLLLLLSPSHFTPLSLFFSPPPVAGCLLYCNYLLPPPILSTARLITHSSPQCHVLEFLSVFLIHFATLSVQQPELHLLEIYPSRRLPLYSPLSAAAAAAASPFPSQLLKWQWWEGSIWPKQSAGFLALLAFFSW